MNINTFIRQSVELLKPVSNTALLDVELLIKYRLNLKNELIDWNYELNDDDIECLNKLVNRRRNGEPISYILGNQEFWSLDFHVSKGALIPRCDTEIGVEYVINCLKRTKKKTAVCEFGVGSGCIIGSILTECDNAIGIGYEKNVAAYRIAKDNFKRLGISSRIGFHNQSWEQCTISGVDIIISNPPYISFAEMLTLMKDVKDYEPRDALYGGAIGMDCYRSIFKTARKVLQNKGLLILEIGYKQEKYVKQIGCEHNFILVDVKKDLANIDRYMIFRKKDKIWTI